MHGRACFWWKYRVVEGCIPNFSSIGVVAPPSPEQNIFLAKHTCSTPKFEDFTSETTTNDCRSIAVAWFWCHTWYLKSAVSAVHQLQVAKLKVLHIASVAHQSSCKLGPKANADGPIQKSADSADGQLQGAKLKVFYIPSVAHQSRCKPQPKANGDRPIKKSADSADGQLAWFGFVWFFGHRIPMCHTFLESSDP